MTPEYLITRKEEAKRIVASHLFREFAQEVSGDMAPIMHRVRERKALFAFQHIQGQGTSPLLVQEAEIRGLTVDALAHSILANSNALNLAEMDRTRINVAIDACTKISEIGKLLIDERVPLPPGVQYHDAAPDAVLPAPAPAMIMPPISPTSGTP